MAGRDSWPRPLRILTRRVSEGLSRAYASGWDLKLTEETYVVGEQVSDVGDLVADHAQPLDS